MATKAEPPKAPWDYSRDMKKAQEDLNFFLQFIPQVLKWWDLDPSDTEEYMAMQGEVHRGVDEGVRLLRLYGGGTLLLSYGHGTLCVDGVPVKNWILDPVAVRAKIQTRCSNDDVLSQLEVELVIARLENRVATLQKGESENTWAWLRSLLPWLAKGVSAWFVGLNRFLQVLLTAAVTVIVAMLSGVWDVVLALIPHLFKSPPAP